METQSDNDLILFLDRQRVLLAAERSAEIERSFLLLSNCGPKLLEQKGLALGALGILDMKIGLGGKTLVELERPTAYHTSPIFPPHSFRPSDLARIEENVSANPGSSKKSATKGKKAASSDATTSKTAEGVVYKVSDSRIVIAIESSDSKTEDLDLPERCRVVKLANSVTYDRMDKVLDQLQKMMLPKSDEQPAPENRRPVPPLFRVLLGQQKPTAIPATTSDLKFFDDSLNESQKSAIRFALSAPEVACIHGPPGTGKTHTLIEVIRQLTAPQSPTDANPNPKQHRVLVCGASNLSVDNILERLLAIPASENGKERLKVTRIGHPARLMAHEGILDSTLDVKASRTDQAGLAKDVKNELDTALGILSGKGKGVKGKGPRGAERRKMWDEVKALRKEYRQREGGVVKSVLSESQVVLATCHSAGGRVLWNLDFDVVIIDEATQALEAVCWIPILKGKKLILAGDPMQLPPTILSLDTHRSKASAKKPEAKSTKEKKGPVTAAPVPVMDNDSGSDSDSALSDDEKTIPVAEKSHSKPLVGLRPPRSLETTLFDRLERMYGPTIKRMLTVQYRMHAQICEFPSKIMYGSRLKSDESVASHLLLDLPQPADDEDSEERKELLGTPVAFYDTAGCEYFERLEGDADEGSSCNENEAAVVKMCVEKLTGVGVLPGQIAVITPYRAQVTLLTSILRPLYGPTLEIGTVDGMQGREKDAILISLVRSNDKREVGFLKDKRRLNVAMTRAKRHLCVIGDSSTVCHGGRFLKKWLAWLEANADVRYAGLE